MMYSRTPLPVPFLKQLSARFLHYWRLVTAYCKTRKAIFEFGRGFYGNTYTPVLSDLTLTPGRLQILCNCKRSTKESWAGSWNEADLTYSNCKKFCVARMAQDCKFKFLDYSSQQNFYFLMMVSA